MRIAAGVRTEQAITDALNAELDAPAKMLPPDTTYPAIRTHVDDVAGWIHDRLGAEFVPTPEETVGANKLGHGIRPIAVWDIPSRIAYRALADRLERQLPPLLRSRSEHKAFLRKPLGDS